MMIDIFKDYVLQREELLARIAQELQLDKTRLERMETAFKAVAEVLKRMMIFSMIWKLRFMLKVQRELEQR